MFNLRRRDFVTLLAAAAAWLVGARAQQFRSVPRIGVLWHAGNAEQEKIPLGALVEGLRDVGYVDSQTMTLDNRFPNEEPERFKSLAAELAASRPDIIVTVTRPVALAAKQATTTIPVFFLSVPDPVESGLVTSLAHPGGNITGLSSMSVELIPKRIDYLVQAVPGIGHIALLINGNFEWGVRRSREEGESAAARLGIKVEPFLVRSLADFKLTMAEIKQSGARGVVVAQDGLFYANMSMLAQLAIEHQLAMMAYAKEMVEAGALISYGADIPAYFRRAGKSIDQILKGTKPADMPVEQPTKFELAVNIKTAKAIGLTVPPALLAYVDALID